MKISQTPPTSPSPTDATAAPTPSDWLNLLLPNQPKPRFFASDLHDILYSVGVEPDIESMQKLLKTLSSPSPGDTLQGLQSILKDFGVTFSELTTKLNYYRRNRRLPLRPDHSTFKLKPMKKYFVGRALPLLFMPVYSLWLTKDYFPRATPNEIAIYNITHSAINGLTITVSTMVILLILLFLIQDSEMTIDGWNLFVDAFIFTIIPTAVAARESIVWSIEGQRLKETNHIYRHILVYSKFRRPEMTGIEAVHRMFIESGEKDMVYLLKKHSAHVYARNEAMKRKSMAPRRSSIDEEIMKSKVEYSNIEGEIKRVDKQYNLCVLSLNKWVPLILAITFAFIPTIINDMTGVLTIFDRSCAGIAKFAGALEILIIFFTCYATNLVLLNDAFASTRCMIKFARWLVNSLKTENMDSSHEFRLDSPDQVQAFDQLHRYIFSMFFWESCFHIKAFEMMTLIAILACIGVFSISLLNLPISGPLVLLWLIGTIITAAMAFVFHSTANTHKILTKDVVKCLRAQRRLNNIHYEVQQNDEELGLAADLQKANLLLDDLCQAIIDEHDPVKLWGILPLTKENTIKMAGAMAASLFTTVLRIAMTSK
ncbi:hypothetical protein TrCOL_g4920 [Triparma columacea]|uniref:Uncharacterized protein n=1 Tax=Triparma columacea TaxID=722753 RepID=A0A9W7GFG2_9STRA|nr:hypothetical protein TrCOL_g4920 [Triparma columacea]